MDANIKYKYFNNQFNQEITKFPADNPILKQ
jgi:hypothetical protein